jgi:hypothetical protein
MSTLASTFVKQAATNPHLLARIMVTGWKFTEQLWWTRLRREGDPCITHRPSVGFTDAERVYVRSAEHAAQYDRGFLKDLPC